MHIQEVFISCQLQRRLAIKLYFDEVQRMPIKNGWTCTLHVWGHYKSNLTNNSVPCLPLGTLTSDPFLMFPDKKKRLTGEDSRRLTLLHRFLLVIHTLQYYYIFDIFDVNKCKLKYRRVDIHVDKNKCTKMLMYLKVDNSKLSISNHYTLHIHVFHINLHIGFSHK